MVKERKCTKAARTCLVPKRKYWGKLINLLRFFLFYSVFLIALLNKISAFQNCYNSRTSDDIDMKLRPVTKLYKRNKTTSKKFDDDVMSENRDVIVIFQIFGQFGAVWRPDSGHRVCRSYVFSNTNLLSYKNWKQNWKISKTALTLLLWVMVLFWIKNANFLQKNADISKMKET